MQYMIEPSFKRFKICKARHDFHSNFCFVGDVMKYFTQSRNLGCKEALEFEEVTCIHIKRSKFSNSSYSSYRTISLLGIGTELMLETRLRINLRDFLHVSKE